MSNVIASVTRGHYCERKMTSRFPMLRDCTPTMASINNVATMFLSNDIATH